MVELHYVEDYRQVLKEPFYKDPVILEFSWVKKGWLTAGCSWVHVSVLTNNNLPGVEGKVHCGGTLVSGWTQLSVLQSSPQLDVICHWTTALVKNQWCHILWLHHRVCNHMPWTKSRNRAANYLTHTVNHSMYESELVNLVVEEK